MCWRCEAMSRRNGPLGSAAWDSFGPGADRRPAQPNIITS